MDEQPESVAGSAAILIVEDEFLVADYIRELLTEAGYQIAGIADRATEAFRIAEAARPALALVDVNLAGGEDGIELARRMHVHLGISSIFLSGSGDPGTRARMQGVSSRGFLLKPFRSQQLSELVRQALQR